MGHCCCSADTGDQNSTNIYAQNVTCRGGNGIAFGSLGQYPDLVSLSLRADLLGDSPPTPAQFDRVENVTLQDIRVSQGVVC